MLNKALVIIDIQNDITKNYRKIIANINQAIAKATEKNITVIYVRQEYTSDTMRTFKPNTRGWEFVPELNIVSEHIFTKTKGSILSSESLTEFIKTKGIDEFYIAGADALACVKITCNSLRKADYKVTVLADCITSYAVNKIPEMLEYYAFKGCAISDSHSFSC